MPLVVEDGSIVSAAVTYVTVAEVRSYAAARPGITLPVADESLELLIQLATDYFEQLETDFQGTRTSGDQELSWPREGVTLFDRFVDDNVIPRTLKNAICQLTCDATVVDLMPTGTGREIIRQKIDVIETEYSPTGSGTLSPELNKAMSYIRPLLRNSVGGLTIDLLRT